MEDHHAEAVLGSPTPQPFPDETAIRTALWRALHLEVDARPHIFTDDLSISLAQPANGWRGRPDMHPVGTAAFRASIVARARFAEEMVLEGLEGGRRQYVIMGAGLDTFAQRHANLLHSDLTVFEIDRPEPQAWKRSRLAALELAAPARLRFVPVDFDRGQDLWSELLAAGFDPDAPTLVSSLGLSMYLSKPANRAILRRISQIAAGSVLVMSFILPLSHVDKKIRTGVEQSMKGAAQGGSPWLSFYDPADLVRIAVEEGFRTAVHVSAEDLATRYFRNRQDGLRPLRGEELLVAST